MKILVGLSWGVDSAVSAYLLQQQWHEVVAGFMKNYTSDSGNCTTYNDSIEAIKVAEHLGIEIRAYDLQKEYQEKVIDYIFDGYQKGITPNPDVLCNSLIKFDVFLEKALEEGFDKIAMGHYARITEDKNWIFHLLRGKDHHKDQTYFLSWLNQFQLSKAIFPIWDLEKSQVRQIAKEIWLPNADRPDSQGLCFIWNVPIKQFLLQKLPIKKGPIKTLDGKTVWEHDGAYFFTIGQKQGLGLNFKAYVYKIDIENNTVYVGDKEIPELNSSTISVKNWHRIWEEKAIGSKLQGKIRYRQNPAVECVLTKKENSDLSFSFSSPQRAIAPGQVFVVYQWEECLGWGIINLTF